MAMVAEFILIRVGVPCCNTHSLMKTESMIMELFLGSFWCRGSGTRLSRQETYLLLYSTEQVNTYMVAKRLANNLDKVTLLC